MTSRIKASLNTWIISLVFLGLSPLFVYPVYLITEIGESQKNHNLAELGRLTESVSDSVNDFLDSSLSYLEGLAHSFTANQIGLDEFFRRTQKLTGAKYKISAVSVVDQDFKVVMLSALPRTHKTIAASDVESVKIAFDTGKPQVSALFKSPINNNLLFAINYPITAPNQNKYCIRLIYNVDVFYQILNGMAGSLIKMGSHLHAT